MWWRPLTPSTHPQAKSAADPEPPLPPGPGTPAEPAPPPADAVPPAEAAAPAGSAAPAEAAAHPVAQPALPVLTSGPGCAADSGVALPTRPDATARPALLAQPALARACTSGRDALRIPLRCRLGRPLAAGALLASGNALADPVGAATRPAGTGIRRRYWSAGRNCLRRCCWLGGPWPASAAGTDALRLGWRCDPAGAAASAGGTASAAAGLARLAVPGPGGNGGSGPRRTGLRCVLGSEGAHTCQSRPRHSREPTPMSGPRYRSATVLS